MLKQAWTDCIGMLLLKTAYQKAPRLQVRSLLLHLLAFATHPSRQLLHHAAPEDKVPLMCDISHSPSGQDQHLMISMTLPLDRH